MYCGFNLHCWDILMQSGDNVEMLGVFTSTLNEYLLWCVERVESNNFYFNTGNI